jgi:hypothetical protein
MGKFRFCDDCGGEYWAHRPASRFCGTNCRVRFNRKLARAREVLGDRAPTRPVATTSVSDAWAELGSRAGDYNDYAKRMRPGAAIAYRCANPACGKAFQAPTRQRFCSLACRDQDRWQR